MVADKKPGRGADQFPLRFPEGMREEIKRLADEDGQSMNTKILELLNFALANSGVDMDEIYKLAFHQRYELKNEREADRRRIEDLETENQRLRGRLNFWEPLLLQLNPEELDKVRKRLSKLQSLLDSPDGNEVLKDILLPINNLAEEYPSLERVQKFFEEIRNKS